MAQAYAGFFFAYNDSPLLIVNASEIDFVRDEEDRLALLEAIENAGAGVTHWSRGQ